MKKILLLSLTFAIGLAVAAQKPQVKNGVFVRNFQKDQNVTIEPFEKTTALPFTSKKTGLKNSVNANIVTVLDLGTSTNVYGYSGGTRPMVWADDDLNCVINFHRMGPGATPPSLSGYYGMDLGTNMGATQTDWNNQIQVLAATLPSTPYWYDASRYPSAGIYNPDGNTSLANAYCAFFGPNFCNLVVSGFGGYSYGTANLVNHTDTAKNLLWYNPTPHTYVPTGFGLSNKTGIAHLTDIDVNAQSGSEVYQDSVIYGRGIWNTTTTDFDYTFKTIAFPCKDMYSRGCADAKIAVAPDGNTVWMSTLNNYAMGSPLIDSTYYPLVRKSIDGGLTWGDPIPIYLGGPDGLDAIKNVYSDYFIQNFFVGPPWPDRDEIPYTTAFDHSLSVDKWGNLHIAVVVGYAPGGYSISTGVDSLLNVFDIYTVNRGETWQAVFLGSVKTFRGTFGDISADNRCYISRNTAGDKMFVTWNDTHVEGEVNNQNPDIWARGFDLIENKITSDNGADKPNNVTFLCDITQEAYWQSASPIVFTDNNKFTIPICVQWFADPAADVQFKYIPDFSYVQGDFTIPVLNPGFPVGLDQAKTDLVAISIYPNPVKDFAKITLNLKQNSNVNVDITNLFGKQIMSLDNGIMNAGSQTFSINAANLASGIYFIAVSVNGEKYTRKMIVE
ncbi:MAG: T9SS type A sorting domain-containing protein [Bacteroidales bacterium]|nr:T9SS type A sorting domain-containing protein [Bacteroidales bacterium]